MNCLIAITLCVAAVPTTVDEKIEYLDQSLTIWRARGERANAIWEIKPAEDDGVIEIYMFYAGGSNGSVFSLMVDSMRHLREVMNWEEIAMSYRFIYPLLNLSTGEMVRIYRHYAVPGEPLPTSDRYLETLVPKGKTMHDPNKAFHDLEAKCQVAFSAVEREWEARRKKVIKNGMGLRRLKLDDIKDAENIIRRIEKTRKEEGRKPAN